MLLALYKVLIFIHVLAIVMSCFLKAVHIELPYKGWEIIMFEEPREDSLGELTDTFNIEWIFRGGPGNDMIYRQILKH